MLSKVISGMAVVLALLFLYLNGLNELTKLKMAVPKVEKEIAALKEENKRLRYEIRQFESPSHLLELSRRPEFAHLKHPLVKDVLKVKEGVALQH
ncbi:MAG: hypothetical protein WC371_05310 [Parachlamydiales bacterium]|jgi:cell division protein FtsB